MRNFLKTLMYTLQSFSRYFNAGFKACVSHRIGTTTMDIKLEKEIIDNFL